MAKGRGKASDERRFPGYEGIGGVANPHAAPPVNGATRGNVSNGAFEQPDNISGPTRLEGIKASVAHAAREAARSSVTKNQSGANRPKAQGGGSLERSGFRAAEHRVARGRGVRG